LNEDEDNERYDAYKSPEAKNKLSKAHDTRRRGKE